MNDNLWVAIRALLMVGGGFLAGKGYVTMDQVKSIADRLPEIVGAVAAVVGPFWALYVRWNTRAVPAVTAARADVPTVSAVTGATEPGASHTS